ncbi:MAG: enoyl-CoA hydratase/isomerase family protein [Calditrichaeota bacterium]|nr:enoyl-CoA hydratase/isomerase family protein [Calditrichota bacterium]
MENAFTLEKRDDGIGILYFDLPGEKVNKFSTPVMEELEKTISTLKNESLKCLLLMSKKKGIFIAGADINEIKDVTDPEIGYKIGLRGQGIFHSFSQLSFPTIAIIDGACMGGGTELSLACTFRAATDSPSTKIALPEVNLGILPGWGGTQRLPRLIGLQKSLDLILSGRSLDAKRAYRMAVVDKIIAAEWTMEKAIEFAQEVISGKTEKYISRRKPKGLPGIVLEKTPFGRSIMFSQAEKTVMKKSGGHYPAPLRALKVLKETHGIDLQKGLDIEARALGDLLVTPICKSLVQIFFWTEEIKKENGTTKKETKAKEIQKAGVLGAGVMGGGIAQLFAAKGIDTRVKDINHDAVTKAYQQASSVLKEKVKRRRMSREEYRQIMLRISGTTDYSGFKNMDLVVEAIIEDLNIKKTVLAELENYVPKDAIIASNTSSLLIDDMAAAMKNKKRFVGMHFFNPVHRMPLVEIIRGKQTSDEAVSTIFSLCKKTGKTPIVVNDGPGFLVNRLLLPYMVEAVSLLEEGHSIQTLDKAMKKFGMPMGPIELFDEVGIDVAYKVAKILQQTMADRMAESDLLEKLVHEKRLGKKNGIGFYKYQDRKKIYDPEVEKFIQIKSKTELNTEQLAQRMVYPMINEAARCLEDNIATNPRDVDVGMIFGTGFAPFRGGLLKFADSEGLDKLIDVLAGFENKFGQRFKPSSYLQKIKEEKGKFYN